MNNSYIEWSIYLGWRAQGTRGPSHLHLQLKLKILFRLIFSSQSSIILLLHDFLFPFHLLTWLDFYDKMIPTVLYHRPVCSLRETFWRKILAVCYIKTAMWSNPTLPHYCGPTRLWWYKRINSNLFVSVVCENIIPRLCTSILT